MKFNAFASVSTGAKYIEAAAVGNTVVHDVSMHSEMWAAAVGNMVVPSRCSWGVQCGFVSVSSGGEHGRERERQDRGRRRRGRDREGGRQRGRRREKRR